jgi:mannose-1-phosphate guanylyltransferase/mannose-6-phosphate isomerase
MKGEKSLFQQSAQRLIGSIKDDMQAENPLIVAGQEHRFLAAEQLREVGIKLSMALLEPEGKNTAPALTMAALAAVEMGEDPILVVTPSDHNIASQEAFTLALHGAIKEALSGAISLIGIKPDKPETGYGYIKVESVSDEVALRVAQFIEKPNRNAAERYLAEGCYYWNAGIFVLKASVWLNAINMFRKDIADSCVKAWLKRSTESNYETLFVRPSVEDFTVIPSESIDRAVVERCSGTEFAIKMIPLSTQWNDLGSWGAVWDVLPKDDAGNANVGDVLVADSYNNLVYAKSRLVALVGVNDLVVVETSDALLVLDKNKGQDVKQIISQLEHSGREEQKLHRKVHRPWGWYDSVDEGARFKVKRIQVNIGASLSLQKHFHRAEHWVVVSGVAEITKGEDIIVLTENQSTYIPVGEVHRLSNPGNVPLEIIEVQSGIYLEEDDIVRIEDRYGRQK